MKTQRISFAITVVNLVTSAILLTQFRPVNAQQSQPQNITPVLRGHALEIIDSLGKVRASITIQPPVEMDAKKYPQTVLLRLIDDRGGPLVKLSAAENDSGLSLSDEADGGMLFRGRDSGSFFKISSVSKSVFVK